MTTKDKIAGNFLNGGNIMSKLPEILTLEQTAQFLQVSTRTVQRMVKEGRMPGRQVGGQWRFDREQLREWVRGEEQQSSAANAQRELIERESARLGVDRPETLIEMQQSDLRRQEARERWEKEAQDDDNA
jgi:excisionase family DNA binding protein